MTGLHGKRGTKESRRAKRPAQPRPEAAAPPPSRRAKSAEAPVPPRKGKREASARTVRPPPPTYDDSDNDEVTTAYVLRNREVIVPDTSKPAPRQYKKPAPRQYKKGEEPSYNLSRLTPRCAQVGLEHYNSMNQGGEHELVKAVDSNSFFFNGLWMHANFLAKRKGAISCVDLVPKYFFAELEMEGDGGISCVSCVKMDPGDPKNFGGCGVCPCKILHPAAGGYRNAQPRPIRHAAGGLQISFSF